MVAPIAYSAISITEDVQLWLRNAEQVRILNCFDRVWNLADERSRVVSVVTLAVGEGPLHIVVPVSRLPKLSPTDGVLISSQYLTTPWLTFDTTNAKVWNAVLPQPEAQQLSVMIRIGKQVLADSVESLAQPYLGLPTTAGRFQQQVLWQLSHAAQAIIQALTRRQDTALVAAVRLLAGKGLGYTPAGDDWLLGAMAALHVRGLPRQADLIARAALDATTVFSASMLAMAGQRKFAASWHRLMQAESDLEIQTAMQQLSQQGHTSGADALTGFVQVLEALYSVQVKT